MADKFPKFDMMQYGFYANIDWKSEGQDFYRFVEAGLRASTSQNKTLRRTFKSRNENSSFYFMPENRYRVRLTNDGGTTIIEKPTSHEVAVVAIQDPTQKKLLFMKRPKDEDLWPEKWYFVSEHIEGRPTWQKGLIELTAHKGAREEVGLDIDLEKLFNPYSIFNRGQRFRIWPVLAKAHTTDVVPNKEVAEVKWLTPEEIAYELKREEVIEGESLGEDGHNIIDLLHDMGLSLHDGQSSGFPFRNRPVIFARNELAGKW